MQQNDEQLYMLLENQYERAAILGTAPGFRRRSNSSYAFIVGTLHTTNTGQIMFFEAVLGIQKQKAVERSCKMIIAWFDEHLKA